MFVAVPNNRQVSDFVKYTLTSNVDKSFTKLAIGEKILTEIQDKTMDILIKKYLLNVFSFLTAQLAKSVSEKYGKIDTDDFAFCRTDCIDFLQLCCILEDKKAASDCRDMYEKELWKRDK